MTVRRRRRNPYSWQVSRLKAFVQKEQEDCRFYEMCYEKMARQFPFKVLSVMVFILKDEYAKKPGSLVTLYREAYAGDGPCGDFEKRYEKYYHALKERGFL
jgi:hypothetical protein